MQTLGVSVSALEATPQHFLELESAENMTQGHLRRIVATSVEQVLRILSRWRHLRRLTLSRWSDRSVPPLQELGDFIMATKHLTYLHLVLTAEGSNWRKLETLRDKVNDFIPDNTWHSLFFPFLFVVFWSSYPLRILWAVGWLFAQLDSFSATCKRLHLLKSKQHCNTLI